MSRTGAYERERLEPGSPEWQRAMTGSKVPAVLGLSPWDSAFSVAHRMMGNLDPVATTDQMMRGHYFEQGVTDWFQDQHPELRIETTGTWANHDLADWQAVNPDRLCFTRTGDVRNLQVKSALKEQVWGQPGTDEVPPDVKAQVQWELETLGLGFAYVAVVSGWLVLAEYYVRYDPAELAAIHAVIDPFMADVDARKAPPIDGHDATYQAVRELHPQIDGGVQAELPDELAIPYLESLRAKDEAHKQWRQASSLVVQEMGRAQWGLYRGTRICSRMGSPDKAPHLRAENNAADQLLVAHTTEGNIA